MAPTSLLILLGAAVILRADLLPEKFLLLPPVNFTIKVAGLAEVLLHWEPNPDQQQRNIKLGYHVKISAPEDDDYETKNTDSKRVIVLHRGVSASVRTILWEDPSLRASSWVSAELRPPAGSPGTSAVNLTCTTNTTASNQSRSRPYQVSLHCSWLAGQEAPEDTQYVLYYRYGAHTEECQEYSQDTARRNTACWFPRTVIDGKGRDSLAVRVSGRSQRAAIKPYDQLFDLHAIDRVNPPGNVTAEMEGTHLSVQWEKPVSAFPVHCFEYEVKIHGTRNGYFQREKMTTSEYNSTVGAMSKYCVEEETLKPKDNKPLFTCKRSTQGTQDPNLTCLFDPVINRRTLLRTDPLLDSCSVYVSGVLNVLTRVLERRPSVEGSDAQKPCTEWILLLLAATVCLFVLSLTCRTCHVWAKLFPPIPAPRSNIQDFAATVNYEKTGSVETESEVLSYVEEQGLVVLEDVVFYR